LFGQGRAGFTWQIYSQGMQLNGITVHNTYCTPENGRREDGGVSRVSVSAEL